MDSHIGETLCVYLPALLGDTNSEQTPDPLALTLVQPPLLFPEPWVQEYFVDVSIETELYNFKFLLIVGFSVMIYIGQQHKKHGWYWKHIKLLKYNEVMDPRAPTSATLLNQY